MIPINILNSFIDKNDAPYHKNIYTKNNCYFSNIYFINIQFNFDFRNIIKTYMKYIKASFIYMTPN